ncbi:MAG: putative DNA binding domain-containing protein [Polyangiaceae bacterium]|nr:putative DNA binding domain-containing protein [Polyangiaceae bacterium]
MALQIELQALATRESEQVEWKENVADIEDVVKTVVAFANDYSNLGGGYVVCGAMEARDEHGFQRMIRNGLSAARLKEVEGKVLALCRDMVDPPVVPIVEEVPADEPARRILVFIVPASPGAHQLRTAHGSKYWVRMSRNTVEARNGILRELFVRKRVLEPWDRRMNAAATTEDIDLLALREHLQRMKMWNEERSVDDYLSPEFQLSPFVPPLCGREPLTGMLRPRNFALLLFGREPTKFFPGAHSVFSIYPGVDRTEQYSEKVMISGGVVEQARKLIDLLNTEAYVAIDKADRTAPNLLKYPQRALQEAVVNAIVHRDYEVDHPTRVTAFSDRIEINSPGTLPSAVDRGKFVRGEASAVWRNQALAYFFNRLQLAQAEGQGIPTILRTMRDEGCPDPIFEVGQENILCILPAHPRHAKMRELKAIESGLLLGHFDEASRRAAALLEKDPLNTRAIELMCEASNLLGRPERVFDIIHAAGVQPEKLNISALLVLGETLASIRAPTEAQRALASQLLNAASTSKLQEAEIRKLVITLRKVKEFERALQVLDNHFTSNPALAMAPSLLELRGKVLIDLAKVCTDTARNDRASARIKRQAWDACRDYLDRADRELHRALEHGPSPVEREYIERDLEFLQNLRRTAQRPAHYRPGGRRH